MCPPRLKQAAVACLSVGTSVCLTWVYMGVQECGATHICYPLSSDYAMRHIGQLFRSNYMFLFQLPWLPEKLLSMSDFQVR